MQSSEKTPNGMPHVEDALAPFATLTVGQTKK